MTFVTFWKQARQGRAGQQSELTTTRLCSSLPTLLHQFTPTLLTITDTNPIHISKLTANMIGPLSRRLLAQQPRVLSQRPVARVVTRPMSYTYQLQARKDTQDKDSLKPEPNEYSKSGSDDNAARVEETAFDPNKTSPEEEHASAGSESSEVRILCLCD
jgi:hypothetical protein